MTQNLAERSALGIIQGQLGEDRGASKMPTWAPILPSETALDLYDIFEVYRCSLDRYVKLYFEHLELVPGFDGKIDMSRHTIPPKGSEEERKFWRLKIYYDCAVRDLTVLDEALDRVKQLENERPRRRRVVSSPLLNLWMMCFIPLTLLKATSVPTVFSITGAAGTLAGALVFVYKQLPSQPQVNRRDPVQRKIQDLLGAFEAETVREWDLSEALIPPIDSHAFTGDYEDSFRSTSLVDRF